VRCPNNGVPLNEAYCLYLSKYNVKEFKDRGFIVFGQGIQLKRLKPFLQSFNHPLPYISVELIALKRTHNS
jgi:hypothetical protein